MFILKQLKSNYLGSCLTANTVIPQPTFPQTTALLTAETISWLIDTLIGWKLIINVFDNQFVVLVICQAKMEHHSLVSASAVGGFAAFLCHVTGNGIFWAFGLLVRAVLRSFATNLVL